MRICILFVLFCAAAAFADDVLAPDWRAESWTTTEEWDWAAYNSGYEPDAEYKTAWLTPDVVNNNAFGQSTSQINLHPGGEGIPVGEWQLYSFGPASGAGWWYGLSGMQFKVRSPNPGFAYTQMRVQVAFGAVGPHSLAQTIYAVMDGNQYFGTVSDTVAGPGTKLVSAVDFLLPGNADEIDLYFQWNRAGFVDQVVIDTMATDVPEPTSMALLAAGAFFLRRTGKP